MTAFPQPLTRLLTIREYAELGETESGYTELVEGRLLMSPSPVPDHNVASGELFVQLRSQVPDHLEVIQDVDVDLEFAAPDGPGDSRRPDLMIVERSARRRVRAEGGMIRASEVHVIIEIVSPGSKRTDYKTKHGEYADAGIRHYWIVDLIEPVSLVACHLADGLGYLDATAVTDVFTTTEPFPVTVRVDQLL